LHLDILANILVVRFEILTAVTLKSTAFWDVTQCSLVGVYQRYGEMYWFHLQDQRVSQASSRKMPVCLFGLIFDPEDGGNTFLRNVDKFLPNYMASHPTSFLIMVTKRITYSYFSIYAIVVFQKILRG
jgi:hypothetical protein